MAQSPQNPKGKSVGQSLAETLESLVVAFILAFVFRAFVVEAFVIPTGSMADSLRGAHFRMTCPTCGCQYNYGFIPENYVPPGQSRPYGRGYIPPQPIPVHPNRLHASGTPVCPMCGTVADNSRPERVHNGDRILVLKYIYQFFEPQRWDVVVFKNPTKPGEENYIKRLIGKPNEKVEIIDGDIYINDQIARKPDRVQNILWIEAFNNDLQPNVTTQTAYYNNRPWPQPFKPQNQLADDTWTIKQDKRVFEFAGSSTEATLEFSEERLRNVLPCFISYNGQQSTGNPYASDLKLSFYATVQGRQGTISIRLGKYDRTYLGTINFDGQCAIVNESNGQILTQGQLHPLTPGQPVLLTFANVDHRLVLTVAKEKLEYIGANDPQDWGYKSSTTSNALPSVALSGQGEAFTLHHVKLYRDNHYTNDSWKNYGRGTEGRPMTLGKDEFFVLGDNSPQSTDSRFWNKDGLGNNGKTYTQGTVPRDYLIGRAFFVYWPAAYYLHSKMRFPLVPNVGQMRFIR